ncbi:MAG: lipid-A-disaccharide synthase [Bacteroidales bacterium]|nr:lipid-A-disaccharide synthase [Bacteroidales bacterium]MDD2425605.1 lipid-A-disaccharide synthase [Bacteroidales bacterium]MDD3989912.1 lipid-A-disaccharide synthase [Bacteroidales bacterium]MDD4638741.1 lipid-A-disaccharide synthase [Bacteroidales bacterium]
MKYYIISGEASGDLHGSNLMKYLLKKDPDAQIRFWGGDRMASLKGEMVQHYREITAMGFTEVLSKLPKLLKYIRLCKEDIKEFRPDVVIPVDFPGFNFRISKFAAGLGIPVFYYIPPTVWAWKGWRIKKLTAFSSRIYVIFPFESEFYRKKGHKVHYFGNPLLDSIVLENSQTPGKEEFFRVNKLDERPVIALLAGSRESEINKLMPLYRELPSHFPDYQFLLAGAPSMSEKDYFKYLQGIDIKLIFGQTYSILKYSQASVVCSGTASLEAALLDSPNTVCYRTNTISSLIVKKLIKVKFVALTNLIFGKEVVKELLQNDCTVDNLVKELKRLLSPDVSARMKQKFVKLRQMLGNSGASEKIAASIISELKTIKQNRRFSRLYKSPMGTLELISDDEALLEISYLPPSEKEVTGPISDKGRLRKKKISSLTDQEPGVLIEAVKQLDEYFSEKRRDFDIPIKLRGTEFQRRVWEELRKIPYGHVKSYGEIAATVETADASRAVGNACKMNPLLIVVPCHRVIGSNNKLTGFNIGLEKKSYLLDLEKAYLNSDYNLFTKTIKEQENDS